MKITHELAYPIIKQIESFTDYNVNIMDEKGIIVASCDPKRVNQIHEGALKVLELNQELLIDEKNTASLMGTKPGVNLPIELHSEFIGVVGVTGDPEKIYKFANFVKMTVEVLLQQKLVYNQIQYQKKMMEGWILDLINPYIFDERKIELSGKHFLTIDFDREMAVFLIKLKQLYSLKDSPQYFQKRKELEEKVYDLLHPYIDPRSMSSLLEEGDFFILTPVKGLYKTTELQLAQQLQRLLEQHHLEANIGIGKRLKGSKGYRESYDGAQQSLTLQQAFHNNHRMHIDDWGYVRLLSQVPHELQLNFVQQYTSSDSWLDQELVKTLQVYFDCDLSIKEASEQLHIHRNTLLYRLDSIAQRLQLDPKKFNDAVTLKIILLCQQLNGK